MLVGILKSYKPGGNRGASTIISELDDDKMFKFSSPILTYNGFIGKLVPEIFILNPSFKKAIIVILLKNEA